MVYDLVKNAHFKKMLEVGTGSGIFVPTLSTLADEIVAADIHDNLAKVQELIPKEDLKCKVKFEYGSITKIGYPKDTFSGVVSISMLEHIKDLDKAFSEVKNVMTKGGAFIIGIPADNIFTKIGYILIGEGKVIKQHHCNTHGDIFRALNKHFKITKVKKFPFIFPIYYAILAENTK